MRLKTTTIIAFVVLAASAFFLYEIRQRDFRGYPFEWDRPKDWKSVQSNSREKSEMALSVFFGNACDLFSFHMGNEEVVNIIMADGLEAKKMLRAKNIGPLVFDDVLIKAFIFEENFPLLGSKMVMQDLKTGKPPAILSVPISSHPDKWTLEMKAGDIRHGQMTLESLCLYSEARFALKSDNHRMEYLIRLLYTKSGGELKALCLYPAKENPKFQEVSTALDTLHFAPGLLTKKNGFIAMILGLIAFAYIVYRQILFLRYLGRVDKKAQQLYEKAMANRNSI